MNCEAARDKLMEAGTDLFFRLRFRSVAMANLSSSGAIYPQHAKNKSVPSPAELEA